MRVAHVGKFYPPEYFGGLESVVVGINDEVTKQGVAAAALVAAVSGPTRTDVYRGVSVRRVRSLGTLFSQPIVPSFARELRALDADLLHLHHPNPLGDLAVAGDSRPLVITQHSDIVRQAVLRPLYLPVLARAFRRAKAITVGSHGLLNASSELGDFRHKTRVIPYGIDPARFAPTDATLARAAELRAPFGARPVVLAVGRLVTYKGFDLLIEAMRGLDAQLVIVGAGPEEARLRALASHAPLSPHLPGKVSDSDLLAWYHVCEVFCLPSRTIAEAFGVVLLEAMACGKPLITTRLPTGVSEVNRDGVTGVQVPPADVPALRAAVQTLLDDPAKRAAFGAAAQRVQREEYSAELMGRRFAELYREVLASA